MVHEFSGFNNAGGTRYVMLLNKATSPANGDTPLWQCAVPAGAAWSWTPKEPVTFGTGIGWALSTSVGTLSLSGSDAWASAHVS